MYVCLCSPDSDPSEKRGEVGTCTCVVYLKDSVYYIYGVCVQPSEDALRFFLSEAEEFVFLLITIFCEFVFFLETPLM